MSKYQIVRTDAEIEKVLDWVFEGIAEGTHVRGMSYEEGIDYFWRWLTGQSEDNPGEE